MLRSYLPGLGLSAAVVAAAFLIYSFVNDGTAGDAGARTDRGGTSPIQIALPPVPGGEQDGGAGGSEGGPIVVAGNPGLGPAFAGPGDSSSGVSDESRSGGGGTQDSERGGREDGARDGTRGMIRPGTVSVPVVPGGGAPAPTTPATPPGADRPPARPSPNAGVRPAVPVPSRGRSGKPAKPGKGTPVKAATPGKPIKARGRGHSGKPVEPKPDHAVARGHSGKPVKPKPDQAGGRGEPSTSSKPGVAAKPDHVRAAHPGAPPAQPESKPKDSQPAPPVPEPAPADDCGPAGNGEGHAYGRCDAPGKTRASG